MLKIEDIRKLNNKELDEEITSSERNLFKVRLDITSGQEKRVNLIKLQRKYIATLQTVKREKELIEEIKAEEIMTKSIKEESNKPDNK